MNNIGRRCRRIPRILMVSNGLSPAVLKEYRILRDINIDVVLQISDRKRLGPICYFQMLMRLLRIRFRGGFDVLHVQFGGIQALIAGVVFFRKVIVTFRGTDLHGGGDRHRGSARMSRRFGVMCSRLSAFFIGRAILVSDSLRQYLPKSKMMTALVISPPIDDRIFRPIDRTDCKKSLSMELDLFYVMFSDYGLDPVKRRDLAIATIEHVKLINSSIRLLFVNGIPHDRMPLYINSSHAILLTSDAEGSPTIIKEALACNVPTVSVDVGDIRFQGYDESCCQLCSRDPESLGRAIAKCIESGGRCVSRGMLLSKFGRIRFASQLLRLYYTFCTRE